MNSGPKDVSIISANQNFKQSSRNRFLGAIGVAVVCLILFIILGPDAERVNKKFEYIGAQGDLKIMDAISIEDGRDKVFQLPKSLQSPPPPSNIEVEKEVTHDDGIRDIPKPLEAMEVENPVVDEVVVDVVAKDFTRQLVSMSTPMQNSSTYFIKHMVRPEYPLNASEADRNIDVFVSINFFVEKGGTVTATMVQKTNGGPAFSEEVINKFNQWILGFYIDPGPGMWLQTTIYFKSPYSVPGRG